MIFGQARNQVAQVRSSDVFGMIDQALGLLPRAMSLIAFLLLVMLVIKAAKSWRSMSIMDMAAVVIAFALVGGAR